MAQPRLRLSTRWLMFAVVIAGVMTAPVAWLVRAERRLADTRAQYSELQSRLANPWHVAATSMRRFEVESSSGRITIGATAAVMNRVPDRSYVWSVRVLDLGRTNVSLWRRYDRQVVTPPWGVDTHLNFAAELQPALPRGSYLVEVKLHEFSTKAGVDSLGLDPDQDSIHALGGSKRIRSEPEADLGAAPPPGNRGPATPNS